MVSLGKKSLLLGCILKLSPWRKSSRVREVSCSRTLCIRLSLRSKVPSSRNTGFIVPDSACARVPVTCTASISAASSIGRVMFLPSRGLSQESLLDTNERLVTGYIVSLV